MTDRTYASQRDHLREALSALVEVAEKGKNVAAADAAKALDKKLVENRFNVVVFGEFKRGKTTFVNALLGADVLATAVVPLTSIVTAVEWGKEIRARIAYLNGLEEDIAVEDLGRFVTERGNPSNRLGVARATLSYPSEDLRDGVFLVDTPGVGSVYQHNTVAARDALAESDAAVFLTSADPTISDAERAFLKEVRGHAARLFFVLNKVDYLSELDRDEAIVFTRGVVADAIGRDVVLYPVSARRALMAKLADDPSELEASGLLAFERQFRAFLLHEKGRAILASAAVRALRLADDERNSLDVAERALELSTQEVDDARHRMERVFEDARVRQRDLHALLRDETSRLGAVVDEDLARLRADEERRLLHLGNERIRQLEDAHGAGEEIDAFLKDTLRWDVEHWRHGEEEKLAAAFRNSTARFVREADRVERETVDLCSEIFGLELASENGGVELSSDTRFSFSFFEVPTILESILPDMRRLLPRAVARRLLERDLGRRIPMMIDKHSGRLRWDFLERLERSRRELELDLDRRLEGTIASLTVGIERAVQDRATSEKDASRAREAMRARRLRLDELRPMFRRRSWVHESND